MRAGYYSFPNGLPSDIMVNIQVRLLRKFLGEPYKKGELVVACKMPNNKWYLGEGRLGDSNMNRCFCTDALEGVDFERIV